MASPLPFAGHYNWIDVVDAIGILKRLLTAVRSSFCTKGKLAITCPFSLYTLYQTLEGYSFVVRALRMRKNRIKGACGCSHN